MHTAVFSAVGAGQDGRFEATVLAWGSPGGTGADMDLNCRHRPVLQINGAAYDPLLVSAKAMAASSSSSC